jgi:hypothetical protein
MPAYARRPDVSFDDGELDCGGRGAEARLEAIAQPAAVLRERHFIAVD